MIEILADFAVMFNDLIALVSLVVGAALLFAPKEVRRVLEYGVVLWLAGAIAQMGLGLSGREVSTIGVLGLQPWLVTVMLFLAALFFFGTFLGVITRRWERRRRRRRSPRDGYPRRRRYLR